MAAVAESCVAPEALPEPGQLVRVRSRSWLVEEAVAPARPSEQPLVRLSCLDDHAQGEELEVLWEREVDAAASGASGARFAIDSDLTRAVRYIERRPILSATPHNGQSHGFFSLRASRLLATSANDLVDLLPALRERGEETLRCVANRNALAPSLPRGAR